MLITVRELYPWQDRRLLKQRMGYSGSGIFVASNEFYQELSIVLFYKGCLGNISCLQILYELESNPESQALSVVL